MLRWTARQRVRSAAVNVPAKLQELLYSIGIEASMWRDLVWEYKRYFGKSSCAGRPESISAEAARTGKVFHRGQRQTRECFVPASECAVRNTSTGLDSVSSSNPDRSLLGSRSSLLRQVKYLQFATFLTHSTAFPAPQTRVPSLVAPAIAHQPSRPKEALQKIKRLLQ